MFFVSTLLAWPSLWTRTGEFGGAESVWGVVKNV